MKKKIKRIYSPTKLRILLLLEAGVALSFAGTIGRQLRVIGEMADEWKDIDRQYLRQIVREFYQDRLVSEQENADGTRTIVLTEKGKKRALTFNLHTLKIQTPKEWNGQWHGVFYDIPEKDKLKRHAFRDKMRDLELFPWQKSVFLYPFPCRDEIDFVVEALELRPHVRYGLLAHITNEAELLLHFNLKKSEQKLEQKPEQRREQRPGK